MIQKHHIDLKDKICMDIGSSTGGFTDCMLQNGSKKYMQLMWDIINSIIKLGLIKEL